MCLLFLALDAHPAYPLVVAANRDEFFDRPTRAMHRWTDHRRVVAGRDLRKGGTWFGVTNQGRWAAVTNYREPNADEGSLSRGALVSDYLISDAPPEDYVDALAAIADRCAGFNLVAGRGSHAAYFSNRENGVKTLAHGIYGLSNHLLDTPWPKVKTGKQSLVGLVTRGQLDVDSLFFILNDRTIAADEDLPESGVGIEWERLLSSAFVSGDAYGTRSSTICLVDRNNRLILEERTYGPTDTGGPNVYSSVAYEFDIEH
jgi:uncharacterized protein with NRDE domain